MGFQFPAELNTPNTCYRDQLTNCPCDNCNPLAGNLNVKTAKATESDIERASTVFALPTGVYEHFKGGRYLVTCTSLLVGKIHDIEMADEVVSYQNKAGERFSRLRSEFEEIMPGPKPRFRYLPLVSKL